jgi:hypothetical protein
MLPPDRLSSSAFDKTHVTMSGFGSARTRSTIRHTKPPFTSLITPLLLKPEAAVKRTHPTKRRANRYPRGKIIPM